MGKNPIKPYTHIVIFITTKVDNMTANWNQGGMIVFIVVYMLFEKMHFFFTLHNIDLNLIYLQRP